jgi:hypothetical protein
MESMRRFALYAAVILCGSGLSATHAAERFGQWSLEQAEDFVFALSFKRPILFDDRAAASQLAFVCNQERKDVAVLLIPQDGMFTSRRAAIPVPKGQGSRGREICSLLFPRVWMAIRQQAIALTSILGLFRWSISV